MKDLTNDSKITFNGVEKTLTQWARSVGIERPVLLHRLNNKGWSLEKALKTASRAHKFIEEIPM